MAALKILKWISCCIIVIANIVSIILALILSALGGALLWGTPLAKQYLTPMLSKMTSFMPKELSDKVDMSKTIDQFLGYLGGAGTALLILGLFLLAVSIIGCCGACCNYKILLIIYAACVGVILLAFLIITIMLTQNKNLFFQQIEKGLTTGIQKEFKGFSNPNTFTLIMSFMQMFFKCCGAKNGKDFEKAAQWNRTYEIKADIMGTTYNKTVKMIYPVSCCKTKNFKPIDFNCTFTPTTLNSNFETGCTGAISKMTGNYMSYVSYSMWVVCLFLAILTAAAIIMIIALFKESSVSPV